MTLVETAQLLGNFGEFFGAIAVVVTLGYLAIQVRQNNRSNKVTRQMALEQALSGMHEQIVANEGLAELAARCRGPSLSDLSPAENERIHRFANLYLNRYISVENAYRSDEFSQQSYDEFCRDFRRTLATYPALKPIMKSIMGHFDSNYGILSPLFE